MDSDAKSHPTFAVPIAHVTVGGGAPVVVQSMTDTDTEDAAATVRQIIQLARAGSELVRITVNTEKAAQQVAFIRDQLRQQGVDVPLIGDFHYNGHRLLTAYPECAQALAKYRINPGNVGFGEKRDKQFAEIIDVALKYDKPVRIGVNWGSLDQVLVTRLMDENSLLANPKPANVVIEEALVQSALLSATYAEQLGMSPQRLILSCKVSGVQTLIRVYRALAARCNYALHLGLTEAGMGSKGIVASSIAMGTLLQQGIGDTLRTSLTPEPGGDRRREVIVSQQILQTMGLRSFHPQVSSCPGCGRTTSTFYRKLASNIETYLQEQMPIWKAKYPGVASLSLAIMGCIVNGPGESKHANIGISLPGTGEQPAAPIFVDGKKFTTLRGDNIFNEFKVIVENYVAEKYSPISEAQMSLTPPNRNTSHAC